MSAYTHHKRAAQRVIGNTKVGDFVCVVAKMYQTKEMDHPLWQAVGRVEAVEQNTSDPLFQVHFPTQIKFQGVQTHLFYSEKLRKATEAEGLAAFMLDQFAFVAKQQVTYDRRLDQAQFAEQSANLSKSDF